jgi:hypothetical protein
MSSKKWIKFINYVSILELILLNLVKAPVFSKERASSLLDDFEQN